jgi:hypothetical protein
VRLDEVGDASLDVDGDVAGTVALSLSGAGDARPAAPH